MRDAIGRGDRVRRSGGTRGCRRCWRQDAGDEGAGDEGVDDVEDDEPDEPDDDEPDEPDEPDDDEEAESELGVVELGVLDDPVDVSVPFVDVAGLPDDFDDPPRLSVL